MSKTYEVRHELLDELFRIAREYINKLREKDTMYYDSLGEFLENQRRGASITSKEVQELENQVREEQRIIEKANQEATDRDKYETLKKRFEPTEVT